MDSDLEISHVTSYMSIRADVLNFHPAFPFPKLLYLNTALNIWYNWCDKSIKLHCCYFDFSRVQHIWVFVENVCIMRGGIRTWTGDLLICSQMLYHWAIPPPGDRQRPPVNRRLSWGLQVFTHLRYQHDSPSFPQAFPSPPPRVWRIRLLSFSHHQPQWSHTPTVTHAQRGYLRTERTPTPFMTRPASKPIHFKAARQEFSKFNVSTGIFPE